MHVPPSEVVKHIDRVFPWIRGTDQPRIGANDAGEIAAIVALVEAIPPHLLFARSARYGQLLSSLAHVRSWLPTWQARGESWAANGQPLRVLRNVFRAVRNDSRRRATNERPTLPSPAWKASSSTCRGDFGQTRNSFRLTT
jgi:hypothetical protein